MKCTTDLPAHIGSGSPWLQDFPALRNSYRKIHNGFNHFVFDGGFLVGDLRCQRIIQPDPSLQANFLNWGEHPKSCSRPCAEETCLATGPQWWIVGGCDFSFANNSHSVFHSGCKTKFLDNNSIVTCKRPKALECKLSTWAAGLPKCTNQF